MRARSQDAAGPWLALGAAFADQGAFLEAAVAFREALAHQPDSLRGLMGVGRTWMALGAPERAIQYLRDAVSYDPEHWAAHIELGRAFHCAGFAENGWQEFVWLYHRRFVKWREFEQPLWDGSSLEGRTLLLWSDPGLGDSLQFLRYLPLVKTLCSRLVFECDTRRLMPFAARMACIDELVLRGAPLPAFDVHVPLASVSRLLRDKAALCTGVPYLSVDEELVQIWRRRLQPNCDLLVGISWGGNRENIAANVRFMPLHAFGALAGLTHARFISLQMGPQSAELLAPPHGLRIECPQDERCSLMDTAALIQNLDLVVTVDTMIAHLTGSLAKPVWMLLPYAADWRWSTETKTSPLYPTMRLFRQSRSDGWHEVVLRIRHALEELIELQPGEPDSSTPPAPGNR
jgi:hypothetical protein